MRKKFNIQVKTNKHCMGERTWIMGILNITPDSFSDGGLFLDKDTAIKQGLKMIHEGADIIDIGGESTRPGSDPVPLDQELKRVIPVISVLREKSEALISIDTNKSAVAKAALDAGADIINDISALRNDPKMMPLAVDRDVPIILMHMLGTPKTMQKNPYYENVLTEIHSFFEERITTAVYAGIKRDKIILDPGIGFGKRLEDNLVLLKNLRFFYDLELPLLFGTSRKSFIGKILDLPPDQRLEGTIASTVIGIMQGAHIVRVHDVMAAKKAADIADAVLNAKTSREYVSSKGEKGTTYVC